MGTEDIQSLEILDVPDEGETSETTFEDIYAFLLKNEDIILTIDADSEDAVRRGLSVVKSYHTGKLKAAGTKVEERTLKFKVIEELEGTEPKQIRFQIWLAKKSSVTVHRMIVSDKGL